MVPSRTSSQISLAPSFSGIGMQVALPEGRQGDSWNQSVIFSEGQREGEEKLKGEWGHPLCSPGCTPRAGPQGYSCLHAPNPTSTPTRCLVPIVAAAATAAAAFQVDSGCLAFACVSTRMPWQPMELSRH